jgi:hypothetical protein
MSDDNSPVFEKGYPSYNAVNEVKAILKLNGGRGALLCNGCDVILSYGSDHNTETEHYCGECYNDYMGRKMIKDKDNKVASPYGGLGAPSKTMSLAKLMEMEIKTLNNSYYASLNRIKDLVDQQGVLVDEIHELKLQLKELKDNANI